MVHYEENLANPPPLDGTPDRAPIEGAFFDCIPSALTRSTAIIASVRRSVRPTVRIRPHPSVLTPSVLERGK